MQSERQIEFCFPSPKDSLEREETSDQPLTQVHSGIDDDLTRQCCGLIKQWGHDKLAGNIVVAWNSRMRSTAGRAFWPEGRIELNPKLVDFSAEEVRNTMLHELAHLLAYSRAGRKKIMAHGAEWAQACCDLGIPNERATHHLPLPSRQMVRKWRYTCPVCGDVIDRVRKMKRAAGCYPCCKQHNGGYYHKKFRLVESRIQ